jgi:hypothetical protein
VRSGIRRGARPGAAEPGSIRRPGTASRLDERFVLGSSRRGLGQGRTERSRLGWSVRARDRAAVSNTWWPRRGSPAGNRRRLLGRGQVVLLLGDAGLGKTRMLAELLARRDDVTRLEGASPTGRLARSVRRAAPHLARGGRVRCRARRSDQAQGGRVHSRGGRTGPPVPGLCSRSAGAGRRTRAARALGHELSDRMQDAFVRGRGARRDATTGLGSTTHWAIERPASSPNGCSLTDRSAARAA